MGLIIAYVIFVIPGFFKLRIGAGDVKYSAVIGFMLGLQGYVEAMAVMGFTIFIYYLFLQITRRGNLKTAAPMAPFLSGGVLVSLFFPLIY
jgi:prepilin signal peptidase PulO-like enzyme (type II secretory pathway)